MVWQVHDRFLELRSHWFTLIGEHLETETGQQLEYWRVERADSVIVLPIANQQFLLPRPMYRPGTGTDTLDFPGGRLPENLTPIAAAPLILQKELGISHTEIASLTPMNAIGWAINSSFSNQVLYGFVAQLRLAQQVADDRLAGRFETTRLGVQHLLSHLTCLQCRALLLEWWLHQSEFI